MEVDANEFERRGKESKDESWVMVGLLSMRLSVVVVSVVAGCFPLSMGVD